MGRWVSREMARRERERESERERDGSSSLFPLLVALNKNSMELCKS